MKTNDLKHLTLFTVPGCLACDEVVSELAKKEHAAVVEHFNLNVVNLEKLSKKKRLNLHVKSVPSYIITEADGKSVIAEKNRAINKVTLLRDLQVLLK